MELEVWKDIANYEGRHQVSNLGRVKCLSRHFINKVPVPVFLEEKIMKFYVNNKGYVNICLQKGYKKQTLWVHRIVAIAFIPNPENLPQVNHIDGNKQNNRADNLEWCTSAENNQHAFRMGLSRPVLGVNNHMYGKRGLKHHGAKKVQIDNNGNIVSMSQAAIIFGCSLAHMSNMLAGKRKNITKYILL